MAAERVLRRAEGSAALVWYNNDTTPMVTQKVFRNVAGDLVFMKKARQPGEFVVHVDVCPGRLQRVCMSLSGRRTRRQRRTLSATGGCLLTLGASRRAASWLRPSFVWDGALVNQRHAKLHR